MDDSSDKTTKRGKAKDGPPPTQFSDLMTTVSGGEFDVNVTNDLREAQTVTGGAR